jgi:hypothetical protein
VVLCVENLASARSLWDLATVGGWWSGPSGVILGGGGRGWLRGAGGSRGDQGEQGSEEDTFHLDKVLLQEPKVVHLEECFKGGNRQLDSVLL